MTSSPLRVLILGLHYDPEPTGNAPYTTALATGLMKLGHHVRVITAHPHYPEWRIRDGYGRWESSERIHGVPVTRLLHFVPPAPTPLLRLVSEVSFGLRIMFASWGNPHVVLLVSPALFSTAFGVLRARFGLRKPAIGVWVQDLYSLGMLETRSGGGRSARLMMRIESLTLSWATGIAAIHDRFKKSIVGTLRVEESNVVVIRNWTHLDETPPFDRTSTREHLGWSDGETIVLHAGNMGVKQGLANVVEAARIADNLELPVRFVLMGDGNQRRSLERLASGIRRIQFLDPVTRDQFQATLGSADLLLVNELPGVSEMSVPSKLTSYFSTGLPVIGATDAGSVTAGELEASGGGIRVDAGEPSALLKGASALMGNRDLRFAMGAAGRRYCDLVLSEEVAVAKYADWLECLAAGVRAKRR